MQRCPPCLSPVGSVGFKSYQPINQSLRRYEQYCMDEYPNGTNAIVAVLAYTGGWGWHPGGGVRAQRAATARELLDV